MWTGIVLGAIALLMGGIVLYCLLTAAKSSDEAMSRAWLQRQRAEGDEAVGEYVRAYGQAYPSDISEALDLDYDRVTEALEKLQQEGRVEFVAPEDPRAA